jgi:hypothetical protein
LEATVRTGDQVASTGKTAFIQKEEELDRELQILEMHNKAMDVRNLMSLDHILYLEDRCNFEEDWYRKKLSERNTQTVQN